MRVLFNTNPWAHQNAGGGEIVIKELFDQLQLLGPDNNLTVQYFNPWKDKIKDFTHIHHFAVEDAVIWRVYKTYPAKLIVTPTWIPNWNVRKRSSQLIQNYWHQLLGGRAQENDLRYLFQLPDLFLPTTTVEQKALQKNLSIPENKFSLLPNGVHPPQANPSQIFCEQYQIDNYLLMVANIWPLKQIHKGIELALAFDLPLVVIGGPHNEYRDYYEYCQELAKSSDQIIMTGRIEDKNILASAYAHARAVLVLSEFETCSLTGMEAASYGVPLLMTKKGGTKEVFSTFAEYIDPAQDNEIKKGLEQLLKRPSRSPQLQKHILDHFSWKNLAIRLIDEYRRLNN